MGWNGISRRHASLLVECLSRRASLTGMYLVVVHLIGVPLMSVHLGVHLISVHVMGYQLHHRQHYLCGP